MGISVSEAAQERPGESQCWELTSNENLPCPGSEADLSSQRRRVVGRHTQRRAEPQQVRSVPFLTEVPPDIVVISWGVFVVSQSCLLPGDSEDLGVALYSTSWTVWTAGGMARKLGYVQQPEALACSLLCMWLTSVPVPLTTRHVRKPRGCLESVGLEREPRAEAARGSLAATLLQGCFVLFRGTW